MGPYLNPLNTDYIEELAEQYRADPAGVDPSWRYFFDGMAVNHVDAVTKAPGVDLEFELKVLELIQGYRELGYLIADVNPLNRGVHTHPLLKLDKFGLTEADLGKICEVGNMLGMGPAPLFRIIETLKAFYCSTASVDFAHIEDPRSRLWIQKRVESHYLSKPVAPEVKRRALQDLIRADVFESFLHKRFVGQKRFSVEGNDVIIPMLDHIIEQASLLGADEILVAMAHRGRLNVLANVFKKDLKQMMGEFSGNLDANVGDGDVKYHMGFSQKTTTQEGKQVHLSLMPNPSHLEAVNPVLMGVCRSKQKLKKDKERVRTLAVMLHGDAAFAGQGVVYELLNMADLAGYTIGGTIHIIVNNQIGFTTNPQEARSTPQATDIAKMMEFPIFRVNADEPEAALRVTSMALQFRYKFQRDVIIDVMGYRRYGHNEGDEPSFTQPLLYQMIDAHPRVRDIYQRRLLKEKIVTPEEVEKFTADYTNRLEESLAESRKAKVTVDMHSFGDRWKDLHKPTEKEIFKAFPGVPAKRIQEIGRKLITVPADFHLHAKIQKFLDDRRDMLDGKRGVDWSMGEALAFGTLLTENHMVRLAGQDTERATFSQRHAVFHDVVNGKKYNPFNELQEEQADFEVVNSLLSEFAAMGFEFGQSLANPNKLTIWEAQFGDFVNGAQIIVDQFLTCSAFKWQRYSGLTLLLPHGYEGQGPEHSSGRLERFLQACAQNNIQVCNMTTPAQYFHVLRRQVLRKFRMPLVIMSPKSLLRNPRCVSSLEDFEKYPFRELIDDPDLSAAEKAEVRRVVFCSGKIYYELLEAKEKAKSKNVAVARVEQFYPFPKEQWSAILAAYPKASEIVWCQEGPQNMEGWSFILQQLTPLLPKDAKLIYTGRAPQASPADSFLPTHIREQKRIVTEALGG